MDHQEPDLIDTAPVTRVRKNKATLCLAYGVFGLPKECSGWQKTSTGSSQEVLLHKLNATGCRYQPDILGSSPKIGDVSDISTTKLLHAALRASFPNDAQVYIGPDQPPSVNHSFVLQQSSSRTVYGVALLVWSKADKSRVDFIRQLRPSDDSTEQGRNDIFWLPYVLCFLSSYPLFNLLGNYVRGIWIHWAKRTNIFQAEEVSRILSFPAPQMHDLVRIEMKDYALIYQCPAQPCEFQNFDMWPLFACLSIPNFVRVLECALTGMGRIILTTKYPAMLTIAAESIQLACRGYTWTGLYVPVVHRASVGSLTAEKGPYILGVLYECRTLFVPPNDAIVVDLDQDLIQSVSPPTIFTKSSSRQKFVNRLSKALGPIKIEGVPLHLRAAFPLGKLVPEGQVIPTNGGLIGTVMDPSWWNQESVLAACDHVSGKLNRNKGLKAVVSGSLKKPLSTKVTALALREGERERRNEARDAQEAWQSYCQLRLRLSSEVSKLTKRNTFLVDELATWKAQFEKFQLVAQELTTQSLDLKGKIDLYKAENRNLSAQIRQCQSDLRDMVTQRDEAMKSAEELTREKLHIKEKLHLANAQNNVLLSQRDEVESVLKALRQLIETQPTALDDILERDDRARQDSILMRAGENSTKPVARLADLENTDNGPQGVLAHHEQTLDGVDKLTTAPSGKDDAEKSAKLSVQPTLALDVADAIVREKTKEITELINKITTDCLAAIDRINTNDENDADGPFGTRYSRNSLVLSEGGTSVTSCKRQSTMTAVSEAIGRIQRHLVSESAQK